MPKLYKRKRDTGIIPELGLAEARRDELAKRDWSQRLKVPEPPDQWTTKECEEKLFSGIRINKLSNQVEIWAVGKKLVSRNYQQVANNPAILATMHEEAFRTVGTVLDVELDRKRVIRRKFK